jgi:histidinol dehydrogenase
MIRIFNLREISPDERATLMTRAQLNVADARADVTRIIAEVRAGGDEALVACTRRYDDEAFSLDRLVVSERDFEEAYRATPPKVIAQIREQIRLSRRFHKIQRAQIRDWCEEVEEGFRYGEKWTPIDSVGLYVPGGKNPFPTVQQILAVAALEAGCPRIVSCISPRGNNYEVLIAACELGLKEVYRVSGAQAIAAMAYGTGTIAPVELIAGPGNPFVTAAKVLCQDRVAIDMPAGPSEAVIIADGSCGVISLARKARYCAADLLARAEHGPDSAGVLVTDSMELAELTVREVMRQFEGLSRKEYIRAALSLYSGIVVAAHREEMFEFTNEYAPEHLELLVDDADEALSQIRNAGSVFLGYFNPVAVGDYASGVNHVLPTGTWAKRTSPVGVWTFMKRVQYSELNRDALGSLQDTVATIADVEGLDAHRRSVDIRFEEE